MRRALIRYAKWLRHTYDFPIRVPVYLSPKETITALDGDTGSASFVSAFDPDVEPYIRIATGDYPALRKKLGRDNSLASFIISLSHEVIHYQQWSRTGRSWERGVIKKSVTMLRAYELTVDYP